MIDIAHHHHGNQNLLLVFLRAFGVLMWETLTLGQQPYPGLSNIEVLHHVRSGGRLESPNNCPDDM